MPNINLFIFLISTLITYITLPPFLKMLEENRCLDKNYLNENIPIGVGLLFVLNQVFICMFFSFFFNDFRNYIYIYIIFLTLMGLAGLLDDLVGEKGIKGFKGHIRSILKGKLTTGGLKAITGLFTAFMISLMISNSLPQLLINIFLIALFTNLINMFDLRPGRAIKSFAILLIILVFSASNNSFNIIMYSALGIILVILPFDIKAKAMLGDVGANSLGITLGFFCAVSHNYSVKIIYLIMLVSLNILGEFISLTNVISNNRILNFFDNLGR